MTKPDEGPARHPDLFEAADAVRDPDDAEGRASEAGGTEPGQQEHASDPVFTDDGGMQAPG